MKVHQGEPLDIYLTVFDHASSWALIKNEGPIQLMVYYTSHRMEDAETRYPKLEKLVLALVTTSRKLRHYFLAHPIWLLTNFPLWQVLQKLDAFGRSIKWSIDLTQYEINYQPRPVIKGQAVSDFLAEFTYRLVETPIKEFYVDGEANVDG